MQPRQPTPEELDQLRNYVLDQQGGSRSPDAREEATDLLQRAAIAVFDDYITDGPDYAGKLLVVIWSGSPTVHETFGWDTHGRLKRFEPDC